MCVENNPPPSGRLTRRGVLAGAAALAGTSAVPAGTAPAASAGVLCHSYSEKGCHDAVTAGIRSREHGAFVGERTLHEMRRRGTYFTPTLTAIAGLAESSDPVLAERGRTFSRS